MAASDGPDELAELIKLRDDLDTLIREYTARNLDRPGVLTGWVLLTSTTRFDDNGDACFAYDYSVSPDTDMIRARGLMELGLDQMKYDTRKSDPED